MQLKTLLAPVQHSAAFAVCVLLLLPRDGCAFFGTHRGKRHFQVCPPCFCGLLTKHYIHLSGVCCAQGSWHNRTGPVSSLEQAALRFEQKVYRCYHKSDVLVCKLHQQVACCRGEAHDMFAFAFDSYLKHAFPKVCPKLHLWSCLVVADACCRHATDVYPVAYAGSPETNYLQRSQQSRKCSSYPD